MQNKLIHPNAFLIPTLILALSIQATSSNPVVVTSATVPGSPGMVQPTLTLIPTAKVPPGTSQSNPAPVGSEIIADNMKFVITGSVRPADGIVSSGDMFNAQPGAYQQYLFANLSVTCETSIDQQCHLSVFRIKLIGSDGIACYPERVISGVDGILVSTDLN